MNIKKIALEVKKGNLVITPTDTVYGIMADATNLKAIKKVYECKQRDENKPLLLLASTLKMVKEYTKDLSPLEEEIIKKYWPGKLTILLHKNDKVNDKITSGTDLVGFRIPDNKELLQIINEIGNPVISTSANISGQATITNPKELKEELLNHISYVEDAGIINNEPSSIIKIENDKIVIIRKESIAHKLIQEYPQNIK